MKSDKELNMQFAILETITIISVVVGHIGGINLFKDWFPIYQWHMPMFLFVSGYFYSKSQESKVVSSLLKKVKKLLIPYFLWNIFYCTVSCIVATKGITAYGQQYNKERFFLWPLWNGTQWGINLAAWFAASLFFIQVIYLILRKILSLVKIKNEIFIFLICLLIGIVGVKLSYLGYRTEWWLTLVKIMFGIAFYALGVIYKAVIEKYIDKIGNLTYFIVVFVMQFWLMYVLKVPLKISMWNGVFNDLHAHAYTPFITAIPAMLFWIRVSKILVPAFKQSRIMINISQNTFQVMMHHQFVFLCLNYVIHRINMVHPLDGFIEGKFRSYGWYVPTIFGTNNFAIFYLFLGIFIPVLFGVIKKKIYISVKEKIKVSIEQN